MQGRWYNCGKIGNPEMFQMINVAFYSICRSMSRVIKSVVSI
jgi:hypothetical protein